MEVFIVVILCLILLAIMRGVGGAFGETIGTMAGIGCLGLIAFGVIAAVTIFLLPVIMPLAIFGAVAWVILKVCCSARRP